MFYITVKFNSYFKRFFSNFIGISEENLEFQSDFKELLKILFEPSRVTSVIADKDVETGTDFFETLEKVKYSFTLLILGFLLKTQLVLLQMTLRKNANKSNSGYMQMIFTA